MNFSRVFTKFANHVARLAGKPVSFALCCLIILVWGLSGPLFHFSDTWQLVINTGTTIVTFLMVFLIQNTQNRDGAAIQAKLDELIRAVDTARNRFIGIEHLTDDELEVIRQAVEADVLGIPDAEQRSHDAAHVRRAFKRLKDAGPAA